MCSNYCCMLLIFSWTTVRVQSDIDKVTQISEVANESLLWLFQCVILFTKNFSDVYLSTVQPQPQHVVIVMDHGNSLSSNQLKTAKGIAKQFLNSLSERDRVGVIHRDHLK